MHVLDGSSGRRDPWAAAFGVEDFIRPRLAQVEQGGPHEGLEGRAGFVEILDAPVATEPRQLGLAVGHHVGLDESVASAAGRYLVGLGTDELAIGVLLAIERGQIDQAGHLSVYVGHGDDLAGHRVHHHDSTALRVAVLDAAGQLVDGDALDLEIDAEGHVATGGGPLDLSLLDPEG